MSEETKQMSALDIFAQSQETFDDAKKKSNEESGSRVNYFRMSQDGDYSVRILPLAPIIDADGNVLPMERKGYEYPVKELVLKIKGENNKTSYVNVCNAKYAFPQLEADLIDTYVSTALSMYADDEKLCKKIKETSYQGGLRYDSKRCMYILDLEKRNDGLQVLQLSFSQYKEVEERKLKLWQKLNKKGNVPCPISSIQDAYPIGISRKTEKKKTTYTFNISIEDGKDELTEDELNMLLDAPRLPEVLYTYKRFHLEATIAYLKQYDEESGMEVMQTQEINDCIDQIKMLLPADDQSHFNANNSGNGDSGSGKTTIDTLWDLYDKLCDDGLDDKSEDGQNLRTSIREFIEENDLDIKITRKMSNEDILNKISEILDSETADDEEPEDEEEEGVETPENEPSDEEENEETADDEEPEDEEEEEPQTPPARSSRKRERNDDTSEPAAEAPARSERRVARPHRPRR